MLFNFAKKDTTINIVIVTGSCCIPGMAVLDEEAIRIVNRAVLEVNAQAKIKLLPVSKAMYGAVPKAVHDKLLGEYRDSGRIGLPAILINGKLTSYGVPDYESVKEELEKLKIIGEKEKD